MKSELQRHARTDCKLIDEIGAHMRCMLTLNLSNIFMLWVRCRFLQLPGLDAAEVLYVEEGHWLKHFKVSFNMRANCNIRVQLPLDCPQCWVTKEETLPCIADYGKDSRHRQGLSRLGVSIITSADEDVLEEAQSWQP